MSIIPQKNWNQKFKCKTIIHPNTPLSNVNPERIIEALKLEGKA